MKLLPPAINQLIVLFLFLTVFASAQPCGDCVIDLPQLPEDTLFLSEAPLGQALMPYDGEISFRIPMTTTPVAAVDPEVPPGIPISNIVINSLTNLPPGLEWELSQAEFDPTEETDGCMKFCGTPLQPGLYMVEVVITATVFIVDETTSFMFPMEILPATSDTEGFSMTNNSGCGMLEVSFINNIPSNGLEGYSYSWDFGNGNSSIDENPSGQVYDTPGEYEVSYEATIDTTGFILTNISVESVSCTDLLSKPDLKVDVIDPDGELIFVSNILENTDPPVSWSMNIPILDGNYTIKVVDDDSGLGGADDVCGTFNINQLSNGTLVDGETTIDLTIINPVQVISSTDTVSVFEQPSDPVILNAPTDSICMGETWMLSTNYTENIQWYQDSVPVLNGVDSALTIEESGDYWVVYTSPDGCIATSEPLSISFSENPESPVFVNDNNLLSIFDEGALPDNYALQWFLDADTIEGATDIEYCIGETGFYNLEVTDLSTGCTNFYDLSIQYNPNFENCVTSTEDELAGILDHLIVFPNPVKDDEVNLSFDLFESSEVEIIIRNALGVSVQKEQFYFTSGKVYKQLSLNLFPAGIYFIELGIGGKKKLTKLIKS